MGYVRMTIDILLSLSPDLKRQRRSASGAAARLTAKKGAMRQPSASPPSEWSAVQVAAWVGSLGLADAAHAFIDNDVEGEALLELTVQELKEELGIVKFGHIKKLRKALDELRERERKDALAEVAAATAAMVSSACCLALRLALLLLQLPLLPLKLTSEALSLLDCSGKGYRRPGRSSRSCGSGSDSPQAAPLWPTTAGKTCRPPAPQRLPSTPPKDSAGKTHGRPHQRSHRRAVAPRTNPKSETPSETVRRPPLV